MFLSGQDFVQSVEKIIKIWNEKGGRDYWIFDIKNYRQSPPPNTTNEPAIYNNYFLLQWFDKDLTSKSYYQ